MIDKSVISAVTYKSESNLKTVDLFYIALLAKDLERMVDHIILLDKADNKYIEDVLEVIRSLKETIDLAIDPKKKLDYISAIKFSESAIKLKKEEIKGIQSYYRVRIKQYLINVSEFILDWAITNEAN